MLARFFLANSDVVGMASFQVQAATGRGPGKAVQITFQLNRSAATEVTIFTMGGRVVSRLEQARTRAAAMAEAGSTSCGQRAVQVSQSRHSQIA